jgi:nucleotide-binding universal stress UspA family protein
MFKKVLIATDSSELSQTMAREAVKKASLWGGEVVALFVVDTRRSFLGELYHSNYEKFEAAMKEEGREIIGSLRRLARLLGVRIKGRVKKGVPGKVIVEEAARENADLIVLGAHSQAANSEKEFRGETTRYVSRNAPCSVLVIRPLQEE